jgi:hypothetical protein
VDPAPGARPGPCPHRELEAQVEGLLAQVAEAERFAEAAEYTLERFGSKVSSSPGRKPLPGVG